MNTIADQQLLYGNWGTTAQCDRTLISPTGTKHAAPFEIKPDWLGNGDVWCRLNWISTTSTEKGTFAIASALCGEDEVRDYRLSFELLANQLTITWNQQIQNGPLQRCTQ